MKGGATCAIIVIADLKVVRWRTLLVADKGDTMIVIADLKFARRRVLSAAGKGATGELRNSWTETT
jgi:hypothetical protein